MIQDFFRSDISNLTPYKASQTQNKVKLDANESFSNFPQGLRMRIAWAIEGAIFNRYPDAGAYNICVLYAQYAKTKVSNIMAGNGSDECIQIIVNTFLNTGDKVAVQSPDFSMYGLYTKVAGGIPIEFPLDHEFKLGVERFISMVNNEEVKIVFLSNPNNPTGGIIKRTDIIKIVEGCKCIVVIDEAYFEFYGQTVIDKIEEYDNLIILRTLSKVGLAAIRLGFLITNNILMGELSKVKPPYNVNEITQIIACVVLKDAQAMQKNIQRILIEKENLFRKIKIISGIKVYNSNANFFLIEVENAQELMKRLFQKGIDVRSFTSHPLKNCLRITVGSREENEYLLSSLTFKNSISI